MSTLFAVTLSLLSLFMVLLVLVQRGRGGGLTGALGGMGGSSAFGAKAGDVFTRITIVTAAIWIVLCVAAAYWAGHRGDRLGGSGGSNIAPSATAGELPAETSFGNPPSEDDDIVPPALAPASGEAALPGSTNDTN